MQTNYYIVKEKGLYPTAIRGGMCFIDPSEPLIRKSNGAFYCLNNENLGFRLLRDEVTRKHSRTLK